HEMADGMERISDWVNSSGTQAKLESLFSAAIDGAGMAGQGFADLSQTVWDYSWAIEDALRLTGELAGSFLTQVSRLDFTVPIQGFKDLMSGMIDFVNQARPGFQSIVDIFGRLGSIGGQEVREVAHGMNLTMNAIDGCTDRIQGPLINAIHPLTRVFKDIAALGKGAQFIMDVAPGVILDLFTNLPEQIQKTIILEGTLSWLRVF